jgi:phage/plasmid-like protein (TIGR03299 family)
MAHNLNYNEDTQKTSFMSVKEKAWHGLGQVIEQYPTSAEALIQAGLNFDVVKRPNIHPLPSGVNIISENSYFTFRTDTEAVLGDKIGRDYEVVQNTEAFSFFDSIVGGKDGVLYETAGALGQGEIIFITAKLPDYIRVGRNDCIEKYLFLTSSHDGTGSINIAFTPVRVVCQNTLNAALRNQTNCIKIRHTASAADKLKEAYKMLGISNQLSVEMEAIYNRWSRVRISDPEVKKLIQLAMIPNREVYEKLKMGREQKLSSHFTSMVSSVFDYAMTSPTQQEDTTKGTLFGAYNAVTGYFQNVRNFKTEESKFKSIMYGTGFDRAQTAFNLCNDFAKEGSGALILN